MLSTLGWFCFSVGSLFVIGIADVVVEGWRRNRPRSRGDHDLTGRREGKQK